MTLIQCWHLRKNMVTWLFTDFFLKACHRSIIITPRALNIFHFIGTFPTKTYTWSGRFVTIFAFMLAKLLMKLQIRFYRKFYTTFRTGQVLTPSIKICTSNTFWCVYSHSFWIFRRQLIVYDRFAFSLVNFETLFHCKLLCTDVALVWFLENQLVPKWNFFQIF